jgi:hypothetical protein
LQTREQTFSELFEAAGKVQTADDYLRAGTSEGHYQVMLLPSLLAQKLAHRYRDWVNSQGQKIDQYCGIVLAAQENAAAGYRDGTFYIGIYEGLINSTLEVVFWLFRSPEFMKDLGAAARMRGTEGGFGVPPGRNWVDKMSRDEPPFSADFFQVGCPVRERAAMQMVCEILSFIMAHEFQHIIQGHIAYFGDGSGVAFVSEDGDMTADTPAPVRTIQRVFEYEADWGAYRELSSSGSLESAGLDAPEYEPALKRMRRIAPFLALYIFTFHWAAHASLAPATHGDPFRRMSSLVRRVKSEAEGSAAFSDLQRDIAGAARAVMQPSLVGVFVELLNQFAKEIVDEEYVLAKDALRRSAALGFSDPSDRVS